MHGPHILLSLALALAAATAARGLHRVHRAPRAGEPGRAAAAADVSAAALAFLAWVFLLKILPLLGPAMGLLRRDFLFPLWALWRTGDAWWWLVPAAAAAVGLLALMGSRAGRPGSGRFLALAAALGAVLWIGLALTNGGWPEGVVEPFTRNADYYADVARFPPGTPLWSRYVEAQAGLSLHGRTHPPGAVAVLRGLESLSGGRLPVIALAVSGLGLLGLVPIWMLGGLLLPAAARRPAAGLWLLTPAVCLYGTVSMDMVFALPLLAGAALWAAAILESRRLPAAALAAAAGLLLAAGFLLTFSAAVAALGWALAAALLPASRRRAGLERLAISAATCLAALGLTAAMTGFDPIACLQTAAVIDAELDPAFLSARYYLLTRLMGALDFLVLAGVAVAPAALRAVTTPARGPARDDLRDAVLLALSRGGLAAAGLFLLAGAYKIGETGRIWLFLLPWVLLPAARRLARGGGGPWPVQVAAAWGVAQAVVMEWLLDTRW